MANMTVKQKTVDKETESDHKIHFADTINNKFYYIEDNVLPFSDHIRDLGIYHDTQLKYAQHNHLLFTKLILVQFLF